MGMLYTGAMDKGQMHGKGSLVYANNEKYEGDFEHGKRHGYGVYSYADGGRFEGEWIDDKVHGRGVSIYASGNRCVSDLCCARIWAAPRIRTCWLRCSNHHDAHPANSRTPRH